MEAYRDQYAKLFNNGRDVVVIGISTDDDTVQANWARDLRTPVTFASDPEREAGKLYGVNAPFPLKTERRVLFVVGPDGRIAHVMRPFRELVQESYDELGEAVRKASGVRTP